MATNKVERLKRKIGDLESDLFMVSVTTSMLISRELKVLKKKLLELESSVDSI